MPAQSYRPGPGPPKYYYAGPARPNKALAQLGPTISGLALYRAGRARPANFMGVLGHKTYRAALAR